MRAPAPVLALDFQHVVRKVAEDLTLRFASFRFLGEINDFVTKLHDLRGTGTGMFFDLSNFGPFADLFLLADVAEQDVLFRFMNDGLEVAIHVDRAEVLVFGASDAMKFDGELGSVSLEVVDRISDQLLLAVG